MNKIFCTLAFAALANSWLSCSKSQARPDGKKSDSSHLAVAPKATSASDELMFSATIDEQAVPDLSHLDNSIWRKIKSRGLKQSIQAEVKFSIPVSAAPAP